MSKFGWSYPAGCSGPPEDDYDDTICARCYRKLPDDPDDRTADFHGFCCWACARDTQLELLQRRVRDVARYPSANTERGVMRVMRELYKFARLAKGADAPTPLCDVPGRWDDETGRPIEAPRKATGTQ
jgi:hypothetical protein